MKTTWIIVADATRARFLASRGKDFSLKPVEQLVHGESRLRNGDQKSDRPGRSFDSFGLGRHAMEPKIDPGEHEAQVFAGEIAHRIEKGRVDNSFDKLVLIAPPHFLGLLRKSIDPQSAKVVLAEIDKELSQVDDDDIRMRLQDILE